MHLNRRGQPTRLPKARKARPQVAPHQAGLVGVEYLDTAGAARFIGMSEAYLEVGRCKGFGPPYLKIGRAVRYSRAALEQWMLAHTRQPASV